MNKKNEYIVSLKQFEGPLDLLHQLIERRKLQINTISLAKVTADYITHVQAMATTSAEDIARCIHIAAILILIKSKSLLPILDYTEEEEVDVAELENRMKIFDYIRSKAMPALAHWRRKMHSSHAPKQAQQVIFLPDNACTVKGLRHTAETALQDIPSMKEPPRKRVSAKIRIEEVIEKVLSAVTDRATVSFKGLSEKANKQEKIVSFLAVLELIRKNILTATQQGDFNDIVITGSSKQYE